MGKRVWNGRRGGRLGSVIFLQKSFLFFYKSTCTCTHAHAYVEIKIGDKLFNLSIHDN